MNKNVCAFSGHRILGSDFDEELLYRVTQNLIKTGTKKFLCGMAKGFDLKAAQCVLTLKKDYDITLTACVPCSNQQAFYSKKDKIIYEEIINHCDEVITFAENYFNGCMQIRDRYLAENCDVLVCYLRKKSGGTYYTVNCAKKANKQIIEL